MEELSQNRQSSIFRDFEAAFAEGKLEYLRQLFLPYILNNIADLYQFKKNNLKEFAEAVGTQQLLQLYLYYKKMPLDMHRYMENQSESIKKEISNTKKERQEAVADWIKTNAERPH